MSSSVENKAINIEPKVVTNPFDPSRAGFRADGETVSDDVRALYRILANQHHFNSATEVIQCLLERSCRRFSFQRGLVVQAISSQIFEIKAAFDPSDQLFVGQHLTAASLSPLPRHDGFNIITEPDFDSSSVKSPNLAYTLGETATYAETCTLVGGTESGVVCFISDEVSDYSFDQEDALVLELLAEGIACMTELQSARAPRKTEDLAIYASGSVKSLEEYQASAELPEGLGISSKVVQVLKSRIGQSSLSIDNIADELNLSKRTLQRRLQQQGISFAELRDRVRFHYSIDYLTTQQISIDRISSTLDFSDRTSFTNAFKRWTGLSPSTFRKVFRDYV